MSRKPSTETQLRTALRDLKEMRSRYTNEWTRANTEKMRADHFQAEAAQWQARFDLLLSKCVEVKKP